MSPPKAGKAEGNGSGNTPGSGNVINLMMLSPPQLQQLRQQVEQELQFYQEAIVSLKDIQVKMTDAANCIRQLNPEKKDLLVPVTGSMFVRGEVEDCQNVLIDIGTGYYVEKSLEDALDYFKRKVEFLSTQIEKVQQVGREKSNVRAAIIEVLEGKMQAQMQQAAAQQKKPVKA
jgi:prefoldin alpha subunit